MPNQFFSILRKTAKSELRKTARLHFDTAMKVKQLEI
jgi:hypothetical protein